MKHWLIIWLCLGAFTSYAHSQALANAGNPTPPPFGILDQDGFFNRNPGAMKRMADEIRKLDQNHGYKIFLVVEPVLIATSAPERASELRQTWVPQGNGLVIVFETDSRSLGVGRELTDDVNPTRNRSRVPSYETAGIITRAMASADPKLAPDLFLEILLTKITEGFDDYFKRRDTPPPKERSMKITLLVVGTLSLLGLGAIGVGGLLRHSSMAAVRRFRFPVVDRPERLGAPCGANVTARRFSPHRKRQ